MKAQQVIRRKDLTRSIVACHKVEDAIWRKLEAFDCGEYTRAVDIRLALASVRQDCPSWCELDAWERIADMFANWATIFDSLQLFWHLRWKREKQ